MSLIQSQPSISFIFIFIFFFLIALLSYPIRARKPHVIDFRSPNLYPEGIAWDPQAQHFIVGSFNRRTLVSVSDAGVVETLVTDTSLPENVTILGLAVDSVNNRLLAAIHAMDPLPPFSALAAYDLRSSHRIFLTALPNDGDDGSRQAANGVAVDFKGNAYVTNSFGNFIWKINAEGQASIFSKSPVYTSHKVDPDSPFSFCGLNGIAYVSKGYLLVVQSNTGKVYKVDADDGTVRQVLVSEDLPLADGIVMRRDGVVVVVSPYKLWLLKSQDSWGEAVVFDKIDLDSERFPTSLAVAAEDRVYVIYGHFIEAMKGNLGREEFRIQQVRSEVESKEENLWIYLLIGLGLAYFFFWRFQMRHLVRSLDKKTN